MKMMLLVSADALMPLTLAVNSCGAYCLHVKNAAAFCLLSASAHAARWTPLPVSLRMAVMSLSICSRVRVRRRCLSGMICHRHRQSDVNAPNAPWDVGKPLSAGAEHDVGSTRFQSSLRVAAAVQLPRC
ncbi:hypothetical protein BD309DRAFT_961577 [Dichomitus squalens]|nr:hypothetical protein BD309DRAFT_961577 [Dichomitus squalens]